MCFSSSFFPSPLPLAPRPPPPPPPAPPHPQDLRVVDGSVMPSVVTGNINIPIVMMAERAADFIKQDHYFGGHGRPHERAHVGPTGL